MDGSGSNLMGFLPIILIFAVFYFLIIRPQNKKAREHQEMVKSLGKGDRVILNGGIMGSVTKVVSDTELEIALEDGKARVVRSMVASVVSAPTKAAAVKKAPAKKAAVKKAVKKKTTKK